MFNIFSRDNAIYGEAVLYSNFTFFSVTYHNGSPCIWNFIIKQQQNFSMLTTAIPNV